MRLVINPQGRASLALVGEMTPGLQQGKTQMGGGTASDRGGREGLWPLPGDAEGGGLSLLQTGMGDGARQKIRPDQEFDRDHFERPEIERCRAREDRGRLSSLLRPLAWPTDPRQVMRQRRCPRPPR